MVLIVEKWRPVRGFEDRYDVSDLGRVRSSPLTGYNYFLSTTIPPKGYAAISLRKNGYRERRLVHKMVADAFLPPRPSPAHEVRHYDGDRANNAADNLRWGTRKDNADDRARHGHTACGERHGMYGIRLFGESNANSKLTDKQRQEIVGLASGLSQRAIASKLGVHQATVWRALKARMKG